MAETAARQSSSVDFVLSCSICQETLSAIYADLDGDDGLRKDAKRTNGSITKLWLTECAHITCGKHLEGGGLQAGSPLWSCKCSLSPRRAFSSRGPAPKGTLSPVFCE